MRQSKDFDGLDSSQRQKLQKNDQYNLKSSSAGVNQSNYFDMASTGIGALVYVAKNKELFHGLENLLSLQYQKKDSFGGITDELSEYLHVLVTSSEDRGSQATLKDISDFQLLMKKYATNYKSACISYMSKGNENLSKELDSIQLSGQRDSTVENSRKIPAKS